MEKNIAYEIIIDWMDDRETYWIDFHGTYENGLNFTRGGQHGASLAWVKASEKRRKDRFEKELMPLFRDYARNNSTCEYISAKTPILGNISNTIRQGRYKVPFEYQHELFEVLKFKIDNRKIAWRTKEFTRFLQASKWWKEYCGEDLSNMIRSATIPTSIDDIGGMKVGELLKKYRDGIKAGCYDYILKNEMFVAELQNMNKL